MSKEEILFNEIGKSLEGAELSKMFGKPGIKVNGKAFACFFQDCMVFKLSGSAHASALSLNGSILFDPSGMGRAMKEWVQVSYAHKDRWSEFAEASLEYVRK